MTAIRIVALYPVKISSLAGEPAVRYRKRQDRIATLVPCVVENAGGASLARPSLPIPDGLPAPLFRAQFTMERDAIGPRQSVSLVLSAEQSARRLEPESAILSPIFDDGRLLIFEFRRARIFTVTADGTAEVRLVAVHPATGLVGTKTEAWFHTRYLPLSARCQDHLAGILDLFPARPHAGREYRVNVPTGIADLSLGASLGGRSADHWTAEDGGTDAGGETAASLDGDRGGDCAGASGSGGV